MALTIDSISPSSITAANGSVVPMTATASGAQLTYRNPVTKAMQTDYTWTQFGTLNAVSWVSNNAVRLYPNSWAYGNGITSNAFDLHKVEFSCYVDGSADGSSGRVGLYGSDGTRTFIFDMQTFGDYIAIVSSSEYFPDEVYPYVFNRSVNWRMTCTITNDYADLLVISSDGVTHVNKRYTFSTPISTQVKWRAEASEVGGNSVLFDFKYTGFPAPVVYTESGYYYDYSLIDTSNSSVISTSNPYNYTADLADNGKEFQWSVTDGVDTVLSDPIPITTGYALSIDSISPTSISANSGDVIPMSVSYSGGVGAVSVALIDTSDSSVLSTSSTYNYTADAADNGNSFQWEVTDLIGTEQSELIAVLVSGIVDAWKVYSYDLGIDMGMEWVEMSDGGYKVSDRGIFNNAETDHIKTSLTIRGRFDYIYSVFESISNAIRDKSDLIWNDKGFPVFGANVDYSAGIPIVIDSVSEITQYAKGAFQISVTIKPLSLSFLETPVLFPDLRSLEYSYSSKYDLGFSNEYSYNAYSLGSVDVARTGEESGEFTGMFKLTREEMAQILNFQRAQRGYPFDMPTIYGVDYPFGTIAGNVGLRCRLREVSNIKQISPIFFSAKIVFVLDYTQGD